MAMGEAQTLEAAVRDPSVIAILSHFDSKHQELDNRIDALCQSFDAYASRNEDVARAFPTRPDGSPDFEGHCDYHTALIAAARSRAEFWRKMLFELTKWGLLGFLGWLLIQAWSGLLHGPKG